LTKKGKRDDRKGNLQPYLTKWIWGPEERLMPYTESCEKEKKIGGRNWFGMKKKQEERANEKKNNGGREKDKYSRRKKNLPSREKRQFTGT